MQLPKGWARSTLGEVCEVSPTDSPLQADAPFVTMNAVEVGSRYPSRYEEKATRGGVRAQENDVLFARITPCLENGKLAQIPVGSPAVGGSTEFIVIRPGAYVIPAFLYYWCLDPVVRQRAKSMMAGATGRMRLSGKDLAQFPFLVPPLAEQYRIVEALEDHLSRLDAALDLLSSSQQRLQSLIYHLRQASINADPDTREIPDLWSWSTIGALSAKSSYGTSTKCSTEASGAPVLRIPNVQAGAVELSDLKYAVDASLDLSAFYVSAGDLLFVRTNGSPSLIGRTGVVTDSADLAFASYLIRFPTGNVPTAQWIQAVLRLPKWRRLIVDAAASSAGQYNLNSTFLGSIPIPMPSQDGIKALLNSITSLNETESRYSAAVKVAQRRSHGLRDALLAAAFSGTLVDQDPADEPASVLLERIAAERAVDATAGRRRPPTRRRAKV